MRGWEDIVYSREAENRDLLDSLEDVLADLKTAIDLDENDVAYRLAEKALGLLEVYRYEQWPGRLGPATTEEAAKNFLLTASSYYCDHANEISDRQLKRFVADVERHIEYLQKKDEPVEMDPVAKLLIQKEESHEQTE